MDPHTFDAVFPAQDEADSEIIVSSNADIIIEDAPMPDTIVAPPASPPAAISSEDSTPAGPASSSSPLSSHLPSSDDAPLATAAPVVQPPDRASRMVAASGAKDAESDCCQKDKIDQRDIARRRQIRIRQMELELVGLEQYAQDAEQAIEL
ncbi:unnamed protein product [Clonostachys solani]|uniref:Uncharacterized protein n=1 Tax=Clonostachys solani TaxID=160281 RepID=A0A9N9ZKN4_9HYPO|nr:unnamed protein product [Clonostachys solani]